MNTTTNDMPVRKPGMAALLSFALPGLGQVYNGRYQHGLALFAWLVVASCLLPAATTISSPGLRLPLFWCGLLATLLAYLFAIGHAWLGARRNRQASLGPLNHGYAYAGLWLLATALWLGLATAERSNVVHAFKIPSASMAPTISSGDYLLATKRPGQVYPVKRGDIVIFIEPDNRNLYYIKRAVGLPSDHVASDGHTLFVNGAGKGYFKGEPFDITVPHGELFVIGDNRDNTSSSRNFGTIPIRDVIGKPILKWRAAHGDTGPM